ncbi:20S proteasome, regulatory subunit alpha type PSMA2/PRE8 [Trachipleistophora hominis]|uniref:20S proteasome, regulatory subunit alpha type PSMA2/PRE8 n=1 Tax=Trachipleistophora hominis TaxID=72359 RepID=L7JTW3_TRAHO|nr:20S proteasome, regulatory subunit alpha type PSMA2/PRE8 [Trachipleistophora hominis]
MEFNFEHTTTVFSSEGKLQHCDKALLAALKGNLSIGLNAADGCVLASLKPSDRLIDKSKVTKIVPLSSNLGITYSGLQPDFRVLTNKLLKMVEGYNMVYGKMYVDTLVNKISREIQEFTQLGNMRPLGLLLLVCGTTFDNKTKLFSLDPSGSFQEVACAGIGKNYSESIRYMERRSEGFEDNLSTAVCTLKEFAGYDLGPEEVQVGVLKDGSFRVLNDDEVKDIFDNINN